MNVIINNPAPPIPTGNWAQLALAVVQWSVPFIAFCDRTTRCSGTIDGAFPGLVRLIRKEKFVYFASSKHCFNLIELI